MTFDQFVAQVQARWPEQAFEFGQDRLFSLKHMQMCYTAETETDEHWWRVLWANKSWTVQSQDPFFEPDPHRREWIAANGDTLTEALANLHEVMLYEYVDR